MLFGTLSFRGCGGQPLALLWNIRIKSQMPIATEHAFKEKSTKLLILLPLRTIYNRTFQCETPYRGNSWIVPFFKREPHYCRFNSIARSLTNLQNPNKLVNLHFLVQFHRYSSKKVVPGVIRRLGVKKLVIGLLISNFSITCSRFGSGSIRTDSFSVSVISFALKGIFYAGKKILSTMAIFQIIMMENFAICKNLKFWHHNILIKNHLF